MNLHLITTNGRLRAYWDTENELMEIRMDGGAVETWEDEPSLDDVINLIERWHFDFKLTTDEAIWIMSQAQSWEAHAEWAHNDLHRYGQIGVTY